MLKTTIPPKRLIFKWLKVSNGEVNRFVVDSGEEIARKSRNLKNKKLSKFRKLAKSRKKLLKSGNSPNFGTTEAGPKFLTPNAKTIFNHLWKTFTKAPIL